MNKLFFMMSLAALVLAPLGAHAQNTPAMVGAGPHGYDFLIGKWTCTNSMPSPMGGPSTTALTVAKAADGSLFIHSTAAGYDSAGYVGYAPKTKIWSNPATFGTGNTSYEWTHQTGKTTTWTGSYFVAADRKQIAIRDTYTIAGMTSFSDLSQAQAGGVWKTIAKTTCTKS